jgi:hypothetical protein
MRILFVIFVRLQHRQLGWHNQKTEVCLRQFGTHDQVRVSLRTLQTAVGKY